MKTIKTFLKVSLLSLPVLALVIFMGCSMVQSAIIPCYIDPNQIEYTGEKATSFLPYTTLFDAQRIDNAMDYVHQTKQVRYARFAEDDNLETTHLKSLSTVYIADAQELKNIVFSPESPLGLLLPSGLSLLAGATLLSKPSDKKRITELETKLNGNA